MPENPNPFRYQELNHCKLNDYFEVTRTILFYQNAGFMNKKVGCGFPFSRAIGNPDHGCLVVCAQFYPIRWYAPKFY